MRHVAHRPLLALLAANCIAGCGTETAAPSSAPNPITFEVTDDGRSPGLGTRCFAGDFQFSDNIMYHKRDVPPEVTDYTGVRDFHLGTAVLMGFISANTYIGDPSVQIQENEVRAIRHSGFRHFSTIMGSDGRPLAFIIKHIRINRIPTDAKTNYRKVLVIAFRGTNGFADFVDDAQTMQVADTRSWGMAHRGFQDHLNFMWPQVEKAVREYEAESPSEFFQPPQAPPNSNPIVLTGHSLGGASAILAAARLAKAGKQVEGVFTYGTPRVGDPTFANEYQKRLGDRTYRFVNEKDIVAQVPLPISLGGNYRHVGEDFWLSPEGELFEKSQTGFLDAITNFTDAVSHHINLKENSGYAGKLYNLYKKTYSCANFKER